MQAAQKYARDGRDLKDELGRMNIKTNPFESSLHLSAFIISFLLA